MLLSGFAGVRAEAQTDEIQVYNATIAAPGVFNLTWHNNYTPSGRTSPDFPGGIVPNHTLNGVAEWAYGVTDWFEAGLYLPLYSISGSGALTYNGFKVRRYSSNRMPPISVSFTASTSSSVTTPLTGINTATHRRSAPSSAGIWVRSR